MEPFSCRHETLKCLIDLGQESHLPVGVENNS